MTGGGRWGQRDVTQITDALILNVVNASYENIPLLMFSFSIDRKQDERMILISTSSLISISIPVACACLV